VAFAGGGEVTVGDVDRNAVLVAEHWMDDKHKQLVFMKRFTNRVEYKVMRNLIILCSLYNALIIGRWMFLWMQGIHQCSMARTKLPRNYANLSRGTLMRLVFYVWRIDCCC
jgi:hypothetical protein